MKVVAELGLSTNGSLDTALRMVEAAAEAGCDGVKVQAFEVSDFLPEGHRDWQMFEENRLSFHQIRKVAEECRAHGLLFGGTPTSLVGVRFLAEEVGVDWLKNGSDYLLRHDMIEAMLATGLPTWVSTGMASHDEITAVVDRFPRVHLMACTSLYPCPDDQAHLSRVHFCVRFEGYSDHTEGTVAAVAVAALGGQMLEKHFTLDRTMRGPDHAFSADPEELAVLVRDVRRVELMSGSPALAPFLSEAERVNREAWRVTEGTLRP